MTFDKFVNDIVEKHKYHYNHLLKVASQFGDIDEDTFGKGANYAGDEFYEIRTIPKDDVCLEISLMVRDRFESDKLTYIRVSKCVRVDDIYVEDDEYEIYADDGGKLYAYAGYRQYREFNDDSFPMNEYLLLQREWDSVRSAYGRTTIDHDFSYKLSDGREITRVEILGYCVELYCTNEKEDRLHWATLGIEDNKNLLTMLKNRLNKEN